MSIQSKPMITAIAALLFLPLSLPAASDSLDTKQLLEKIEHLEQRIKNLESARTFTQFMPDFAERFHVMHRAGNAGDWAVAGHELSELKRLMSIATDIDAEKGKLMQSMLGPSLKELDENIDQADKNAFQKTLRQTVNTCNACHTATNSPFIQVTLDASSSLGMRHPHKLIAQHAPEGHTHGAGAEAHDAHHKTHDQMSEEMHHEHDDEQHHGEVDHHGEKKHND